MHPNSCPGVRNDLSTAVHRFMTNLTDAQHKTVGHTVLYVPNEGTSMASPDAHKHKELVQRLEGQSMLYSLAPKWSQGVNAKERLGMMPNCLSVVDKSSSYPYVELQSVYYLFVCCSLTFVLAGVEMFSGHLINHVVNAL